MDTQNTLVDFFCGAGGFTEGFSQLGFNTLYGYDNWDIATRTYNHNFGLNCEPKNILDFLGPIEEIDKIPNTAIIVGSPPCVSFSSSNKSGKADKNLGLKLIKSFLRVVAVKKHQPHSILEGWFMENVVNSRKFLQPVYTFSDLDLSDWSYSIGKSPVDEALRVGVNTVVLNSADYGSYQARKRSISGEIFCSGGFVIPKPTHSETDSNLPNWETLGGLMSKLPPPTLKSAVGAIQDPVYPEIEIATENLTDHFYDSGLYECEWKQSRELKINHHCMGKMSFPEKPNKPSRTITATKSGTSREGIVYKSEYDRKGDGEYRSPTVREIASIMGFPITYQFAGNLYAKWRQIGNAVCPTVSGALAAEFLRRYDRPVPLEHIVQKEVRLNGIIDLNTFTEAAFTGPPKRTKNSRFRRHPIKDGNLTVTLSNFDIKDKNKPDGRWLTSIQYGTGADFKHQIVEDGCYKRLEDFIKREIKDGEEFVKIINNGFSEKIANSSLMQKMYEQQRSEGNKQEPTYLIDSLREIINQIPIENELFEQTHFEKVFHFKNKVPLKQVLALYGVNKIATLANEHVFS